MAASPNLGILDLFNTKTKVSDTKYIFKKPSQLSENPQEISLIF